MRRLQKFGVSTVRDFRSTDKRESIRAKLGETFFFVFVCERVPPGLVHAEGLAAICGEGQKPGPVHCPEGPGQDAGRAAQLLP